ncbi:MAG: DUF2892 domain-containing protein [Chloroflexota bacterium]
MKLRTNVGSIDRGFRIVLGTALVAVALAGALSGPALAAAWIAAAIALVTGAVGFCPLYALLGISTADNRFAFRR